MKCLPLLNQDNDTLLLLFVRPINYYLGRTQAYKHFIIYSNVKSLLTRTLVCELNMPKPQDANVQVSLVKSDCQSHSFLPETAFLVIQTLSSK